jgi:hypothetical protein
LKKLTGSVCFSFISLKSKKPNRTQIRKKNQAKPEKTESKQKNQAKPV